MANGTKELHTSPITIEDEINEFSEKPVQGKTLYKKLKELEDGILPDTAAASIGDALVLDNDKNPTWGSAGGSTKYLHSIVVRGPARDSVNNEVFGVSFNAITDSPTPITASTITALLTDLGATPYAAGYPCAGGIMTGFGDTSDLYVPSSIVASEVNGYVKVFGSQARIDFTNATITVYGGTANYILTNFVIDTVTPI